MSFPPTLFVFPMAAYRLAGSSHAFITRCLAMEGNIRSTSNLKPHFETSAKAVAYKHTRQLHQYHFVGFVVDVVQGKEALFEANVRIRSAQSLSHSLTCSSRILQGRESDSCSRQTKPSCRIHLYPPCIVAI